MKNNQLEKNYTWYTNKEVFEKAEFVGSGIINMDLIGDTI